MTQYGFRNAVSGYSRRLYFLTIAALILAGCEPAVIIEGHVTDTLGQALPGAGVTVQDTAIQAETDGLGNYRLYCPKSYLRGAGETIMLSVIKSGYGSGRLRVRVGGDPVVTAPDAVLWTLPQSEGVFVLRGHRYQRMTPANTRRYIAEGRELHFGTKKNPQLQLSDANPRIFSHRMHGYDLQLARLERIPAVELPEGEALPAEEEGELAFDESVWVASEDVPLTAYPVDEPERFLYEAQPTAPLAPGHYAIHWGALKGFLSTDPRLFLFEIIDPDAEAAEAETAQEEAQEGESAADGGDE